MALILCPNMVNTLPSRWQHLQLKKKRVTSWPSVEQLSSQAPSRLFTAQTRSDDADRRRWGSALGRHDERDEAKRHVPDGQRRRADQQQVHGVLRTPAAYEPNDLVWQTCGAVLYVHLRACHRQAERTLARYGSANLSVLRHRAAPSAEM